MTKLPSQHSMSGHHRHASETPFKWRFAGGSMMARLWCYLVPLIKKNVAKLDPLWQNFLDPRMKEDIKAPPISLTFNLKH